ncbi:MAG: Ig-like domain-containing protein [Gemmatimonadota bacterium]
MDLDRDGYTVTLDGDQSQSMGVNITVVFPSVATGEHSLELSGVRNNCTVSGDNPRTVTLLADSTTQTTFDVSCSLRTVAAVSVSPDPARVFPNAVIRLTATPFAADGDTITGATFTWQSSDPAIVTVDDAGNVRGIAQGETTVTATSGAKSGTAAVGVNPVLSDNVRVSRELSAVRPHQFDPYIVADGQGRLFVAWRDADFAGGAWLVAFGRSLDGGRSWSASTVMDFADPGPSDGGDTWSANVRVTTRETSADNKVSTKLGLAVDQAGTAYLVWTDYRSGDADIYSAHIP